MKIAPLDFVGQGAMLQPADQELHDRAVDFCKRELRDEVNLARFNKVWVVERDTRVLGVAGYVLKTDVPLMRVTDPQALRLLGHRLNDYFADNGARGHEVFMYIGNERAEQRCPEWRQALREFDARSARRVAFTVR